MTIVPISSVGSVGVVSDRPAHTLPPEVWSDSRNMRFRNRQARKMGGHTAVLGTPTVSPGFLLNVPALGNSLWLYGDVDHVYAIDAGVHTQVTRAAGATPYTAVNLWDWNTSLIGGVPILNNGADVPQYWPALSVLTDLADLPNWGSYPSANNRARVVRSFGLFLVAMNLNNAAGTFPHRVLWSHPADPGSVPSSWNVNDPAVDAGQRDLTDVVAGEIRDGLILGNQFIIYKESASHAMRFVGGIDIMAFDLLFDSGILATRCVCRIDKGSKHFVVTEDDVIVHNGTRGSNTSVVEEKNRERIFTEIEQSARNTCFVFEDASNNEAYFCYPIAGATMPNRAFVYNYKNQTCGFRDWNGLDVGYGAVPAVSVDTWDSDSGTWDSDSAPWQSVGGKALVIADPTLNKFFQLNLGSAFGAASVTSFLERVGLALTGGETKPNYTLRKQVIRVWPKLKGAGASNVKVQIGSQEEIDGPVAWTLPKTFDPSVKYVDFDEEQGACGRLNSIRFESASDAFWQCDGYDLDVYVVGEH